MKLKNILITSALTLSLLTSTAFAADISDFTDAQSHWARDTIEIMVEKGIMNGVSTTSFAPDDIITYGEVLAIATRLVAPEYIEIGAFQAMYSEEKYYHWALDYYIAAANCGIVDDEDLMSMRVWAKMVYGTERGTVYNMNQTVTREEMAVMLCSIAEVNGETLTEVENIGYNIADYNFISSIDEVKAVQSSGLMTGVDSQGTFDPYGTLTRAEATTIFCRLMNYIDRVDVVVNAPTDTNGNVIDFAAATETPDANGAMTIYEGKIHENVAKEGDIVIKEDGTTVVLAYGEHGILGEGQGVAPNLGLVSTSGNILKSGSSYYSSTNTIKDSFGNSLNNQTYSVNPITGSGHWGSEITVLLAATKPTSDGTFKYELSDDCIWIWTGTTWMSCFNMGDTADVEAILEYNGL